MVKIEVGVDHDVVGTVENGDGEFVYTGDVVEMQTLVESMHPNGPVEDFLRSMLWRLSGRRWAREITTVSEQGNPFHRGKGEGGGQFTSKEEAGVDRSSRAAKAKRAASGSGPNNEFEDVASELTPEEWNAVFDYVTETNEDIATYLNGGESALRDRLSKIAETPEELDELVADVKRQVKTLDSIIDKSTLADNVVMYRGVHGRSLYDKVDSLEPGESFTMRSFTSASLQRSVAESFAKEGAGSALDAEFINFLDVLEAEGIDPYALSDVDLDQRYDEYTKSFLLRIQAKKGQKAFYTASTDEEVILPRNTKFTIQGVSEEDPYNVLTVTYE